MLRRTLRAVALFTLLPLSLWAQEVSYLGSYTWSVNDPDFGGFSGLEIDPDGAGFVAISDRGRILEGQLTRGAEGRVIGVSTGALHTLLGRDKTPMPRYTEDAEGLAISRAGRLFISFEGDHRVWSYGALDGGASALPKHSDFARLQRNSGLEALAIDDKDRLYTMAERSGAVDVDFPVYRYGLGRWEVAFSIPRRGKYLPVGMDFDAQGRLYLLERWFRGIGFSSRVRRFDLSASGIVGEAVLIETGLGEHDNLEGIAVWSDARGTRITMISDDNLKPFQITEFVDYRVID